MKTRPTAAVAAAVSLTIRLMLLAMALSLAVPAAVDAQGGGAGTLADDSMPRTVSRPVAAATAAAGGRGAHALSGSVVTQVDSFLVMSHGFDDLLGNCNPRGWSAQDLTSRLFAHVSDRFTVNDSFVSMGTRALWFGADSSSAPDEVSTWATPHGYGNGWSQRLTSPSFSVSGHPGAVLRFDASIGLRRNIDTAPTTNFTPYGLASGKVANDFVAAQGLRTDGTWVFLHGRFSVEGGPAWESTAPLFVNRVNGAPIVPSTMQAPAGVAVDDSGHVYVADQLRHRILKFTSTGQFLLAWGTQGSGPGQFESPRDVAVDQDFNVYVVDFSHRVQKFTAEGGFIAQWGSLGAAPGQLNGPWAIAADRLGNVFVADAGNHRVQKFTDNGAFQLQWGAFGTANGQFRTPSGITVDQAGSVYVTERDNHRVQKFTSGGGFLASWGSFGTGQGQFDQPHGIDVDREGFLWVADRLNHRIQRFTTAGSFLLETGTIGGGGGHFFFTPAGIAASRNGDLYVAEIGNSRIQHFTLGGPIAGENTFRYEVRLNADGNPGLGLAEPRQVRVVMQSNYRVSSQDGLLFSGQHGIVVVDNLSIRDSLGVDLIAATDFEDGTTNGWTLSAHNGGYVTNFNVPSTIRDDPLPATSVALRRNLDPYDASCVWSFLSPGDTVATGAYARIASPWIALAAADSGYFITGTTRLNTLRQSKFLYVYTRGKSAGESRPSVYHTPSFLYFGTTAPDESASPLENGILFRHPDVAGATVPPLDSIQIVFEVLDQPERLLGTPPQARPIARLPILDDLALWQYGVDPDFDGVADALDACPDGCAAGEDANGDGCVDSTATLRHVESWARDQGPIRYRISQAAVPSITDGSDLAAVRDGFLVWTMVDGAQVPLLEEPVTTQQTAGAFDGVNLVTFQDAEVQFPPGVLAVTPTTSFTRRTAFDDRIALPGQIVDSDMIFNPLASFGTGSQPGAHDLRSTTAHEAGHMLGLSHSGVLDATMFFVLQSGQDAASLTNDDRSAVAAAYPAPHLSTAFGTITGTVLRGQTGNPVPGALVTAVRLNGGGAPLDSAASDYTREDGTYALRRLVPGNYSVRVTPLDGNVGGYPLTPAYISQRLLNIAETLFPAEWWSMPDTDRDDPALRGTLAVAAGQTLPDIDVTTTVDTIPPFVTSVLPADSADSVSVGTPLLVNFSEPITATSLQASFRLRKDGLPPSIAGNGQLLDGTNFVFTPSQGLEFNAQYEIEISPDLQDLEGLALADTFRAVFTTEGQPPLSITDIQPRSVPTGGLVTITGTGFDYESTFVRFSFCSLCDIVAVPGSNITPTSLVVRVPGQAVTGPVTLIAGAETSNAFDFTVLPPQPQVAPVPSGSPVSLTDIAPTDAAVSPEGTTAYAAGDGGFATVDLSSPARTVTKHLDGNLRGLALTPDGARAVVCRPASGEVLVFGASPSNLGTPLAIVPVGGRPGGVGISPDGRRAYITDPLAMRVHEIDLAAGSLAAYTVLRQIQVPGAALAGGVAVSLDGGTLYLSSTNLGLLALDLVSQVMTVQNPTPNQGGVAIVPSGGEVLAPGASFNASLVLIQLQTNAPPIAGQVFLGGSPRDVGITPEGQSALVVNSLTNELHVVDVAPGSPTYHHKVSTVATGMSPLSVGVSSLSPVLAVANYGDRTLSIYTTSGADQSVERVVPDHAMPGDMVAVQSSNDIFTAGTDVDLGSGPFAASHTPGVGVGFVVPSGSQRATTLTLENSTGTRSLALPFQVVDPIQNPAPRAGSLRVGPGPSGCGAETGAGIMSVTRISPDGRMLAVARNFQVCNSFIDLYRISATGSERLGQRLATVDAGIVDDILDLAFTPDGTRLVVAANTPSLRIVDTDPASITFGTSLGLFGSPTVGTPYSVLADPLGRFLIVGSEAGGSGLITFLAINGSLIGDILFSSIPRALAASPDGRYLVAAAGGQAHIVDLDTRLVITSTPLHGDPEIALPISATVTADGKRALGVFPFGDLRVWNLDPTAGAIGAESFFGRLTLSQLTDALPAPDGDGALVGCFDCDSLFHVEPSAVPPTVQRAFIGQTSRSLARSHDGRRLWVADHDTPGVSGNIRMMSLSEASALTLVTGPGQTALAGQVLPLPVRVRLTGPGGAPQVGVVITFQLDQENDEGTLDDLPRAEFLRRITDVNGETQVSWRMPSTPKAVTMEISAIGIPGTTTVAAEGVANDAQILPQVVQFGPANGTSGVNAGTAVFARFNQRMDTTALPDFMHLAVGGNAAVAGTFSFQEEGRVAVFDPATAIPFGSPCTLAVEPGARDTDGQSTASLQFAAFTVEAPPSLAISSIMPPSATSGATLVIGGEGFATTPSSNVVTFNGVLAPVQSASLTSLSLAVPIHATSGPVEVRVGGSTSNSLPFTVLTPSPTPGDSLGEVADEAGVSKVAFTPDGARAYVTNSQSNSVTVLDVPNATILTNVTVGLGPLGIAILPDGSRAYVANSGSDNLSVIDADPSSPTYHTVVNTILVGDEPVEVVASGVGPKVFVVNYSSGTVSIIDAQAGNGTFDQVVTTVNTGSGSSDVTITPDGTRMYVATANGVAAVDLSSLVVTTVNTGSGSSDVTITPDGTLVLALLLNGTLVVIDVVPGSPNFNQVVTTVNTGSGSSDVTITPDGTLAYVTSADGNVVQVFQIVKGNQPSGASLVPGPAVTLTRIATIPVGQGPSAIALDPSGSGIGLVPNAGSGTITIIGFRPVAVVEVGFDFSPSLNLKSMGKWMEAHIRPPPPRLPSEIVLASIRLNGAVPADLEAPSAIEDGELKVKFMRSSVQLILAEGDSVPVTVSGVIGQDVFTGTDHVKVRAGKVKAPRLAEVVNPTLPYTVRWEIPSGVRAEWVGILHSLDHGATWILDASHVPNTGAASWDAPDLVADSVKVAVVMVETELDGDTLVTGVFGASDYFFLASPTAVSPPPAQLEFSPITPSPSVGRARLRFGLPRAMRVDLEVFDVQGRRLVTLVAGDKEAGWHEVVWEGGTDRRERVGPGLYFARLRVEGRTFHQRVIWVR
jgi:YVTN family beta-propeller protein